MDRKQKILIVDDEPDNIRILAETLKENYTLAGATSGREALECISAEAPPDLILLDIVMPDMDGYEVLRKLKADRNICDIPVIFITVMENNLNEILGFELGAVDYITKPFSPAVVSARVRTHLELKHYRDYLERMIYERTEELSKSNKMLREKILVRNQAESLLEEVIKRRTEALEKALREIKTANAQLCSEIAERQRTEGALGKAHSLLRSFQAVDKTKIAPSGLPK